MFDLIHRYHDMRQEQKVVQPLPGNAIYQSLGSLSTLFRKARALLAAWRVLFRMPRVCVVNLGTFRMTLP